MDWSRSSNNYYHILKSSPLQFGSKAEQIGRVKGKGAGMACNPCSIADAAKSGTSAAVESGKKQFAKSGSTAAVESGKKQLFSKVNSNRKKDWEPEDDGIDTSTGCVLKNHRRRLPVFEKICPANDPYVSVAREKL